MCRFVLDWCAATDVLPLCVYVLYKILVGSRQLAWGLVLGEGRGWGMSPRRILLHEGIESSSKPFYDRKFDESTACRIQARRAARLFRCTVHGTLPAVLAGRYSSSSNEIAPLLSKNDLKYMYASCDVCWIFPLSYMLLLL